MDNKRSSSIGFSVLLYVCFFLSGATALIYQVVWTRKCSLLLGSTSLAVSSVLGIFFLGMGIGSILGGKLTNINRNGIRMYAVLEILIGSWALIISEYFSSPRIVESVFKIVPSSNLFVFFVRLSFAVFWFLVPAVCMGMTYPLLAKYEGLLNRFRRVHLSLLYMANTLGATTGAFLSGFVLVPNIGFYNVILVAVSLNLLVGMIAWAISSKIGDKDVGNLENLGVVVGESTGGGKDNWILQVVYVGVFVSGFVTLALEVLWTRLLIMILLGTTYSYSSVLVSVLTGIGLGALLLSITMGRIRVSIPHLGLGYFICGLLVLLTIFLISILPTAIQRYGLEVSTDWAYAVFGKFLLTFLVLVLPMVAFGYTFPYALCVIRRCSSEPFVAVGRAYGINTIGSILGSVFGGFVILPLMGCENGVKVLGSIMAFWGIMMLYLGMGNFSLIKRFVSVFGCGGIFVLFFLFVPANIMEEINKFYIPQTHNIIFFSEGVEGTVAVSSPANPTPEDERVLWINRVQATTAIEKGVRMNRFQAILPLLFDREPKKVLFMCFGSGITCGTLAISGFEKIDAVEISPEVIEASKFFEDKNLGVLRRSNVDMHIDDARNFLIRSNEKYDFITLEPMPLALAGVSAFYSEDFYRFCMGVMSENGMMSQWVPFHSTDEFIVKSVVATFLRVFPEAKGFFINSDLFIVGAKKPLNLNPNGFYFKLNSNEILKKALEEAGFPDLEEVFATFVMDRDALLGFSKDGKIITDRNPWVEFSSPKFIYYRGAVPVNIRNLKKHFVSVGRVISRNIENTALLEKIVLRQRSHYSDFDGIIKYYESFIISDELRETFIDSLKIDPNNYQAKYYLRVISKAQVERYISWDEKEKARNILREVSPYLSNESNWNEWLKKLDL